MLPEQRVFSYLKPNPPLHWYVLIEDVNAKEIVIYNIFWHSGFLDDCRKAAAKYKTDREAFLEAVKTSLLYYYWSKTEWEIILSSWPPRKDFHDEKIDVYDQVVLNWPAFEDYIWTNRKELLKRE